MDSEEIRKERQEKASRKAERLREWAKKSSAKGKSIQDGIIDDFQFWSQPGMINTKHKLQERMKKGVFFEIHAMELEKKANRIENSVRVKGDAERKREEQRQILDTLISIGSWVRDFSFGLGEVVRVNKKTYTIKFLSGSVYTREKTFVKPVTKFKENKN